MKTMFVGLKKHPADSPNKTVEEFSFVRTTRPKAMDDAAELGLAAVLEVSTTAKPGEAPLRRWDVK